MSEPPASKQVRIKAARKLYLETKSTAWQLYVETLETETAWQLYLETVVPAWKLYNETKAQIEAEVRE